MKNMKPERIYSITTSRPMPGPTVISRPAAGLAARFQDVAISRVIVGLAVAAGAFLRLWQINAIGFNTDEAVYAGQAAAISGVPILKDIFPIFRAHPLLIQFLLSLIYKVQFSDLAGRLLAVAFGLGAIYVTYLAGKTLYGRIPGALAALFLALMPYHVSISRQFLLDGPMMFFSTLTLYMLARFGKTNRVEWLYAAGAALGLTVLSKETGIVLLGAVFLFLALSQGLHMRIRDLAIAVVLMVLVISPMPVTLMLAGRSSTGNNYLIYQLFRRPNHTGMFYLQSVPVALGFILLLVALLGLILLWRENSWRETLLLAWILVTSLFFEVWPVKGFQYLLPIAPPMALLAGRWLGRLAGGGQTGPLWRPLTGSLALPAGLAWVLVGMVSISLGITSWQRIQPQASSLFLAGTGGVPGGREAGLWIRQNLPLNSRLMTIGPSMANIVEFYGERSAYGLSINPNPLHRNPAYDPILNPDRQLRDSDLQYIVWDSYSAARSKFFADKLISYVQKYNGRAIHTETIQVKDSHGNLVSEPVIIIYEVHP
jgi:4-amino-4-deoxy-L-arabinose transferase-like glycosyltransferase